MEKCRAKYTIGQIVHHKLFDYRGVVIDVDPYFQGTDEWYEMMALSKPPKDTPWYHVCVDKAIFRTYVAERNLEEDTGSGPIDHPDLNWLFDAFEDGYYHVKRPN